MVGVQYPLHPKVMRPCLFRCLLQNVPQELTKEQGKCKYGKRTIYHLEKANLCYQSALAEIATLFERSIDCMNGKVSFKMPSEIDSGTVSIDL